LQGESIQPASNWNIFQGIAGAASIIGLVALLAGGLPTLWKVILGILLLAGIVTIIVVSILARRPRIRTTERSEMMEKGEAIIRGTMGTLVMFGGDMSWAGSYAPAIKEITDAGKTVVVVYPSSEAQHVRENATLLSNNGATLKPIAEDTKLRGFLVDPDKRDAARFWLATRRLKREGRSSPPGMPGVLKDYEYITQEFTAKQDPILIDALLTIYRLASQP
jgi:membrane protein implicated in regulation of membrane protease activity